MVWYYLNGVSNILSHHQVVISSGWDIKYSTNQYQKSKNIKDLRYDCVTLEEVKITSVPTKDGSYVLNCGKYFKSW